MKIRKANISDLSQIVMLEAKRFALDPWNEEQWKYEFEGNKFAKIFVLTIDNQIIGYVDFWILFEQATINKVCIDENYSHQGLGDYLLKAVLKDIDKNNCISTTLEVRVSNENAIKLYEKNLFKTVLKKEHYYNDGEDCFFMIRSIGDVYER